MIKALIIIFAISIVLSLLIVFGSNLIVDLTHKYDE